MKNLKRLLAIISLIILLGGIITICIILFNSKNLSDGAVRGLVSCLIALPIIAYGYSILVKYASKYKHMIQDDINDDQDK